MEIDRLPVGIIPRIKRTTVCVEFIGEYENHLPTIFIGWYVVKVDRRVLVDEAKVTDVRYLTGGIGVDGVPTVAGVVGCEVHNHRVADTGGWRSQRIDGRRCEVVTYNKTTAPTQIKMREPRFTRPRQEIKLPSC